MRIRKKPWAAKELAENLNIIHNPEPYKVLQYFDANQNTQLDISQDTQYNIFQDTQHDISQDTQHSISQDTQHDISQDTQHGIHLELGCGKGRFIVQTATQNPTINHIAIEREPIVLAVAARKAREVGDHLTNLKFLNLDASELAEYFNPGEIHRLYINFCDPWHRRKKWAKRRLTHSNFLSLYEKLKIPEIFFKTDNRILFEFSINQFSEQNWVMKNISLDLHKSDIKDNVMTEYEEKFSASGPIYRLEACNKSSYGRRTQCECIK